MKLVAPSIPWPRRARPRGEPRPGVRDMVVVGLHRWRLDRELADGRAPGGSGERALRARQLGSARSRRQLANALRGVVADAHRPAATMLRSAVPVCRRSVVPLGEALHGLADRFDQEGSLNPCGLARARVLVTDGSGPLYNPVPARTLEDMVWWIADGLQPCPPHDWDSPVIMKLDPEHVAWTCRRCGEIGVTDDPAIRPA
jgi:hypothetical protein